MEKVLVAFGSFFAVIFLLICKAVMASVHEMQNPDLMFFEPSDDIESVSDDGLKKCFNKTNAWANFHGFQFIKHVDFFSKVGGKTIKCMFWKSGDEKNILGVYYTEGKVHYDLVTKFEKDRGLTTSSTKDGGMLPTLPENYTQYFPGQTLNEIWKHHTEAERFIEQKLGCSKEAFGEDIISEVKKAIRKQVEFVKSIFLWQIRGPYWFLIRKNIVANKKVVEELA